MPRQFAQSIRCPESNFGNRLEFEYCRGNAALVSIVRAKKFGAGLTLGTSRYRAEMCQDVLPLSITIGTYSDTGGAWVKTRGDSGIGEELVRPDAICRCVLDLSIAIEYHANVAGE